MLPCLPASPRVCICIPVYNGEKHVLGAVESALGQAYPSIHVIVFDNASTDNSLDILSGVKDNRLTIRSFDEHVPVGNSFARAVMFAEGELVLILGSDDRLLPGAIHSLVAALAAHPECGVAFGRATYVFEGQRRHFAHAMYLPRTGIIEDLENYVLRRGYSIPLCCMLIRHDLKQFTINASTGSACDLDLILRLGQAHVAGIGIELRVAAINEHENAISAKRDIVWDASLRTLLEHFRLSSKKATYLRRIRRQILWLIVYSARSGDRTRAKRVLDSYSWSMNCWWKILARTVIRLPLALNLLILARNAAAATATALRQ